MGRITARHESNFRREKRQAGQPSASGSRLGYGHMFSRRALAIRYFNCVEIWPHQVDLSQLV